MDEKEFLSYIGSEKHIQWLRDFANYMQKAPTSDIGLYHKLDEYSDYKYGYLHEQLEKAGFVNGQPELNTFMNNPDAHFWWVVYGCSTWDYGSNHHASSEERCVIMINKINKWIDMIRGENNGIRYSNGNSRSDRVVIRAAT